MDAESEKVRLQFWRASLCCLMKLTLAIIPAETSLAQFPNSVPIVVGNTTLQKAGLVRDAEAGRLHLLEPGVFIPDQAHINESSSRSRWNRVVLLSTPRLETGEIELIPESIQKSVARIPMVIMATCNRGLAPNSTAAGAKADGVSPMQLQELGVGYCVAVTGGHRVISSAISDEAKSGLGFYGKQVLSENEKQLKTLRFVGATNEIMVFDAPAIFHRNSVHQDVIMRHAVAVDPVGGTLTTYVWLLEKSDTNKYVFIDDSARRLAEWTREDRKIHVDGREFFLGIPNSRSFAMVDLPPGEKLRGTPWLKEQATQNGPSAANLEEWPMQLRKLAP